MDVQKAKKIRQLFQEVEVLTVIVIGIYYKATVRMILL